MLTRVNAGRWPSLGISQDSGGGVLQPANSGQADGPFFMSNEIPDSRSVLTDDFRRGYWYLVDSDHTNWAGTNPDPPAWGGTIFANPITPAGAIRNLQSLGKKPVFSTSGYAATTGFIAGQDGGVLPARNHAWHNLYGANNGGYDELYIRFYLFYVPANYWGAGDPAADYTWGQQKGGTINRWNDSGGIFWAGMGYNTGFGRPDPNTTSTKLTVTNNHGANIILHQNQGVDLLFVPGHWYYAEAHIKLNSVGSANGIWELWANDGGPTGDFSSQTPTKRSNFTNVDWGRTGSDTQLMGSYWPENWSNPASVGEQLWANIHVKAGAGPQIGFVS